MPDNKLKILYDTVSQDFDLGSYDDFLIKIHNPEKRRIFFDTVGQEYDLGNDYNMFEQKISPFLAPYGPSTAELGPPPFEPQGQGYDYATAEQYGITPDETGHMPSRVPETGQILKGTQHPTFDKTVAADDSLGYKLYQGPDGKMYSFKPDQVPEGFQPVPVQEDSIGDPWKRGLKLLVGTPGRIIKGFENLLPAYSQKPFKDLPIPEDAPEEYKQFLQSVKEGRPLKEKAEYFTKKAEEIKAKEATGKYAKPPEDLAGYLDPKRIYMTLAENLPQMAGFMAATIANPYVGFLTMGAAESGDAVETIDQYEKDTGQKVPDEYKKIVGAAIFAFNGALEQTGMENILKIAKIPGMRGKLIQYMVASQTEGVTEALQELNQLVGKMGYSEVQPGEWQNLVDAYYAGNILAFTGGAPGLAVKRTEVSDAEKVRGTIPSVPKETGKREGGEEISREGEQLPTQQVSPEISGGPSRVRPEERRPEEEKKAQPRPEEERIKEVAKKAITEMGEVEKELKKPKAKKPKKQQFRKITGTEDAVKFGLYEITDEQEIREAIKRLSAEGIKLANEGKSAKDVNHQKQMLSEALGEKIKKFVVYKPGLKPGEEGHFEETEYTKLQQELRDRIIKQEGREPEVVETEKPPEKVARKKVLITNKDKSDLRDLGYTPADYRKFTPEQAQGIIDNQTRKEAEKPKYHKGVLAIRNHQNPFISPNGLRTDPTRAHRDIAKELSGKDIHEFMYDTGHVRVMGANDALNIEAVKPLTTEQFNDIELAASGLPINWDISNRNGKIISSGKALDIKDLKRQINKAFKEKQTAEQYINRIRNKNKKAYARSYAKWVESGQKGKEPVRPKELGAMAAQAVRTELDNLIPKPVKDLTKKPTKKKEIPDAQRNLRRYIRDKFHGVSEQDLLDRGVIEKDRRTGKTKIIERGLYMQLGGIGEAKLDDLATELIGETTAIPSDVLWDAIYNNKKLGEIGAATVDPFVTNGPDPYERQVLSELYRQARSEGAIPGEMTEEEFINENTAKSNNTYIPPEEDVDVGFEPQAKYDRTRRIIQIKDFDKITLGEWAKVNEYMKKHGYDYRGAEDARELFRVVYEGRNIFSGIHGDALRYALNLDVPPEIRQLMKDATEYFHLTDRPEKAGFLMPDGKMLNLNRDALDRAYDHSEIEQFMPDEIKAGDSHYSNYKVLAWDNFYRMSVSGTAKKQYFKILIGSKPNPAQVAVLRKIFNNYPADVMIDLVDQGDSAEYLSYGEGTRADKILSDIDYYFRKGELPPVNNVQLFRSPRAGYGTGQTSLNLNQVARPKGEPEIKFMNKPRKVVPKEVKQSYRPLKEGEEIYLERKYKRSKVLKFFARSTEINSPEDVAYMFRQLEGESIEHVFVLHITESGKPVIQHLTTGTFNSSLVSTAVLNDAIERFGTKEMYFIHNHPSGTLRPSEDDVKSLIGFKDAFPQIKVHNGIIIDTYKNKFVTFDENEAGRLGPTDKGQDVKELAALSFSQLYFRKPNSIPDIQLNSPSAVAGYVSGLRFSPDEKVMAITVTNNYEITGRFYLSPEAIYKAHIAVNEIAALTARSGGNHVFLAINGTDHYMGDHGDGSIRLIREGLEKRGITIPDVVRVEPNQNTRQYKSLHEAGARFFSDVKAEYEKEFIKKKAAEGVDVRKIETAQTKLEKREKLREKKEADRKKGQEDIFDYTEKKKQTDLFGEPLSQYAKAIPFRNGDIVLPDALTPQMPDDTLMGKLERIVGDELKLRIFEHAKEKAGGTLSDENNNRYLKLKSELTARVDKVLDQITNTFDFWLERHRDGEGWADQLLDISGEHGLYQNGKEAFGIYEGRYWNEPQKGKLGYLGGWNPPVDVRQEIVDRYNDELAIHVPETEEELIKDLRGHGFDDEIKRIQEEYEYAEDQLRELWYEEIEPTLEGYPEVYDVEELTVYWDGDWNNEIGQLIKEVMETSGYQQWRDVFGDDLVNAEDRIEAAFKKLNQAKSLDDKLAAINISLNVEHVFGKMGQHLDLDQGELTRLSEMGNEVVSFETTPQIREPEAEYKFERPEVEAEYQASHGITKPSLRERIKEKFVQLKHELTRGKFEFLPRTAEFAQIRAELLRLGKQKDVAHQKTLDTIDGLVSNMDKRQYSMYERLVLLSDLMEEVKTEHELPGNWTEADVEYEYNRLLAESDDTVQRAFTRRKDIWEEIKDAYIEAQEAIGFHVEGRFDRENYFRHQVLEFANAKGLTGTGKRLRTPTGRGFLKQREGSHLSINTNYLQAEYEVMSQMLYDIQRARVIEAVDRIHNIQDQLKGEAKSANERNVMPFFEEIAAQMTGQLSPTSERGPYTAEEAFRIYLNTKIAIGMSKLSKLASEGQLADIVSGEDYGDVINDLAEVHAINQAAKADFPDEPQMWRAASLQDMGRFFKYIAEVMKDPNYNSQAKLGAATVFKGIREKNEFIKDALGDRFATWETMIPEGFVKWQPREGQVIYFANSIPERAARDLFEGAMEEVGISKDMIRKVMAIGGARKEYVIPEELANQLDKLVVDTQRDFLSKFMKWTLTKWKIWTLISPRRYFKYNARNMTGDADAVFIGNPRGFLKANRATKELYQAYTGQKKIEDIPDLAEWFAHGGMGTLLQAQEMGDLNKLKQFKKFDKKMEGKTDINLIRKYFRFARLSTDMREAILRYANYLEYLEQIKANPEGKPKNYGASIPSEVDALESPEDKAFWLSNDLLGAYDDVSVFGQQLRSKFFPFWSWKEVNFKRYVRFIKNTANSPDVAERIGRSVVKGAPVLAMKVGSFIIRAVGLWSLMQVWNQLFFSDEEDDLPRGIKKTPHLIFGRNEKGEVIYFNRLGALGDFLEWFGLQDAPYLITNWMNGRTSIGEVAANMAKAPVNVFVQGARPEFKIPAELVAGQSFFPDVFNPRTIKDKGLHIARGLGLQDEYIAIRNLPTRGYTRSLRNFFFYEIDPYAAAYMDIYDAKDRYMREVKGENTGAYAITSPKSMALYNMKLAIKYQDKEAAERYFMEYLNYGGTGKGLRQSILTMHPKAGLNKEDLKNFLENYITPEERRKWDLAVEFFDNVIAKDVTKLGGQK